VASIPRAERSIGDLLNFMQCPQVQEWLFNSDDPGDAPRAIADHLAGCEACRGLAARVRQLEADWRALPLPPSLAAATRPMLPPISGYVIPPPIVSVPEMPLRLAPQPVVVSGSEALRVYPPRRRHAALVGWAIAVAATLVIGVGVYFASHLSQPASSLDVFDRLLDWNVALAEAAPAERAKIYEAAVNELHRAAASPASPDNGDAELLQALFDNADWMNNHADSLGEAERLSAVADKLLARMQQTARSSKRGKLVDLARQYGKLKLAIQDSLDLAELDDSPTAAERLATLTVQEQSRANSLSSLIASLPSSERQAVRKAVDQPNQKPHKHKKKSH